MKRVTLLLPIVVLAVLAWAFASARMRTGSRETPILDEPRASSLAPLEEPFGPRALRGRVVDIEGRPIAGAVLYFRSNGIPFSGESDADGRFAFEGLDDHDVRLAVLAWGHPPRMHAVTPGDEVEIVIAPPLAPPPPLVASTSGDLSGRVSNPLGRLWWDPEGYEIAFVPRAGPSELGEAVERRVRCAPGGQFTVPDLVHGAYEVRVLPSWASGTDWPDLVAPASSRIEHGPTLYRSIAISLRCGALEGTLREPGGRTLEGAVVLLAAGDERSRIWPPLATDAAGRFHFLDLPPGRYLVTARAGEGALLDHEVRIENGQVSRPELPAIAVRQR